MSAHVQAAKVVSTRPFAAVASLTAGLATALVLTTMDAHPVAKVVLVVWVIAWSYLRLTSFGRRMQLRVWAIRGALTDAGRALTGWEICEATGLRAGAIYPLLTSMVETGDLVDHWGDEAHPRRYYRLTGEPR